MNSIAVKNLSINFVRKNKKLLLFLFKLLFSVILLLYIFSSLNFNDVLSAAANANYYLLTLAFLLGFLNLFLQYWKWKTVCNFLLDEKSKRKILFSLFYGFSAGIFTPGRIGEYFGRKIVFKNKSLIKITAASFIDKLFPLLIVILFGLISCMEYLNYFDILSYKITIFFLIILFFILFFSKRFFSVKKITHFVMNRDGRVSAKIKQIILNLNFLEKLNKKLILKLVIISFLFYMCFIIQFAILFSAFSESFSFLKYLWIASLIMFVKTFVPQISIGEFGIREGTAIYFLMQIGGYASTAFSASIFLFLINLLFPAVIGLSFLYKKNND